MISKDGESGPSRYFYEENGLDHTKALLSALGDRGKELGLDALGGFLSGLFLSGGKSGYNAVQYNRMGQEALDTGSYRDYISLGLMADHDTEAYRYAEEIQAKLNTGRKVTNIEMGHLTAAVYAEALGVGEKWSGETREEPDDRTLREYVQSTLDDFQTDLEQAFGEEKTGISDSNSHLKTAVHNYQQPEKYEGIPQSWRPLRTVTDDEVLKGTNPNYSPILSEYRIGTRDDYTHNCTNCVVAYSQRSKGYAVTARPLGECKTLRHGQNLFSAWKGRKPILASGNGLTDILEYLNRQRDGAQVVITVKMPKSIFNDNTGHAFIAERRGGEILFLDPQSGTRYNDPEKVFRLVQSDNTYYMRIDDLELTDRGISACKEEE